VRVSDELSTTVKLKHNQLLGDKININIINLIYEVNGPTKDLQTLGSHLPVLVTLVTSLQNYKKRENEICIFLYQDG
jgi:hypothetical protein